jgi:hypothetical protein
MAIKVEIERPRLAEECRVPARDGKDVFFWSEFVALAKRLGILQDRPIVRIVLDVHVAHLPTCFIEMGCSDVARSRGDNDAAG